MRIPRKQHAASRNGPAMPAEPTALVPRSFLRPCVLLLLREQPAHGYELLERLQAFGFDGSHPAGQRGRLHPPGAGLLGQGLITRLVLMWLERNRRPAPRAELGLGRTDHHPAPRIGTSTSTAPIASIARPANGGDDRRIAGNH